MKRFSLMLLGAVGAFFVLSPAEAADFRVIQWNATKVCQIYDFSWGFRPIPRLQSHDAIAAELCRCA